LKRKAAAVLVTTPHGDLCTRPETEADADFLFSLFETVKGPEMAAMPADGGTKRQLLSMQFRAMTQSYHAAFPGARYDIILLGGEPIGRLILDLSPARAHVVYVALVPQMRNRGIGTALMAAILHEPRRHGAVCEAQVAIGNTPSLRLWKRLGFVERERSETDVILEWRSASPYRKREMA
jgi:ribosomal protein S18 acetylase RimI-like enzyme